ncbi:hypothetical protein [Hymenobacter lapidiphilus]|uniref:Uncharacterized protein n=1 Tax=Hymenobacter lapidiphilus TaxID=2608003 RepID=A0A7Y7U7K6_9BACT|nr:hypothetical protein [Hymenobacter lapidiphilus]NVO33522.1 hypothetical protein [Hymenobacter lapidiphilus]
MLLQTAELTKATADAAQNVGSHAGTDPFTAVLWLLVLVFGGVAGLLIYKLIWKDRPATAADLETVRAASATFTTAQVMMLQADLARIVSAIDRLTKAADTLTTVSERQESHGRDLSRHEEAFRALHQDLKEIRSDLKDLYRATPTA